MSIRSYKDCQEAANALVQEYYDKQNDNILSSLNSKDYDSLSTSRQKILDTLAESLRRDYVFDGTSVNDEEQAYIMELIKKNIWGYGPVDDFIHDEKVSDIKLYNTDNVRIKTYGKRSGADVYFGGDREYEDYVLKLLEKNKVNLGTANAIQTFTDSSQDDAILRITAMSGILVDSGKPCIAIRKIPKVKPTLEDLENAGMFRHVSAEERSKNLADKIPEPFLSDKNAYLDQLMHKMISSKGIIFTGKGASGKTTLMNAMLHEIPHDESIMICQENQELYDNEHPDLLAAHVLVNDGDSKVSYNLGDLTRAALLFDLDRVIVGEVKEGSEAAGLSKASMTGHKCWTSVHGESCAMAIDKMADYISQATGYKPAESLKQITGFEYVIHLRNFNIDEIIHIDGWDTKNNTIKISHVYPEELAVEGSAEREKKEEQEHGQKGYANGYPAARIYGKPKFLVEKQKP